MAERKNDKSVHQVFAEYFPGNLYPYAYLLSKELEEGSVCLSLQDCNKVIKESEDWRGYRPLTEDELKLSALVSTDAGLDKPFVLKDGNLYLQRYFSYESEIISKLKVLSVVDEATVRERKQRIDASSDFLNLLFENFSDDDSLPDAERIHWQLASVVLGCLNNFTMISGGPGTGKTTTIARLLYMLFNIDHDIDVVMAAPTGKAASRLFFSLMQANRDLKDIPESFKSGISAIRPLTIHRLLGYKQDSPYFKHNGNNYLKHNVVVIDEASMIDIAMMSKLLDAIRPGSRVILIGDRNQLASVEAGSVFGDLCNSAYPNTFSSDTADYINKFIPVQLAQITKRYISERKESFLAGSSVELMRSYRYGKVKQIGALSREVFQGFHDEASVTEFFKDNNQNKVVQLISDFDFRNIQSNEEFVKCIQYFEEYILEKDIPKALEKLGKVRILCAVREGHWGIKEFNRIVEDYLVQRKRIVRRKGFYDSMPIMITENNYSLSLFNGDTGIVRFKDGKPFSYFEKSDEKGNLVIREIDCAFLSGYETAFTITIHKSQGSEFNHVVIVLPENQDNRILTKELLYTGITRAKESVLIISSAEIVHRASVRQVRRASGIISQLKKTQKTNNAG